MSHAAVHPGAAVHPINAPFADARADQLHFSLSAPRQAPLAHTTAMLKVPGGRDAPAVALTVELAILGTSHQVTVSDSAGTVLVRETLACLDSDPALPVPAHQRTRLPWGVHTFRHSVARPPDVGTAAEAAVAHAASLPLSCAAGFPGDPHAVTVLACESTADGLSWRTWHCYPQAAEVVETHTVFALSTGAEVSAPDTPAPIIYAPAEGAR